MSERQERATSLLKAVLPGPVRNLESLRGEDHLSTRVSVLSILCGAQVPDSKATWSYFRQVCVRELEIAGNCLPYESAA